MRKEVGNNHDPFTMSAWVNIPGKLTNFDIAGHLPQAHTDFLLYLMMVWRFPLLSLSRKVTTREKFSKEWEKGKELYIEPKKIIRSNDAMSVGSEAELVPEKQSTESGVDENDSPKEPVQTESSSEIEVIEDIRNEENIIVIVFDWILKIELFLLVFIICIHEIFLSLFFLVKFKLKHIGLCKIQSNFSKADKLYNGHLATADTVKL